MAGIEIAVVFLIAAGGVILLVIRSSPEQPVPVARAIVGIVAGTLGALVILTPLTNLVPDAIESTIAPIGAAAITVTLVILSTRFLSN